MKNKAWHNKQFISFLTLTSFLTMSITGIVIYFNPQGRIAYWTDWTFLGLAKSEWGDIHITTSLFFLIAGLFHIYYNWKALTSYIIDKMKHGLKRKKEMAVTLVITAFIVLSGIYKIPPLNKILEWNSYFNEKFWVLDKGYEPPFGHAEELSLKAFTKKMDIDFSKALTELKNKGIKVDDEGKMTLIQIARQNNINPMQLYAAFKHLEPKIELKSYTPDEIDAAFAGKGTGRRTLDQFCKEADLDIKTAKSRLKRAGIQFNEGENIKSIAENNNMNAHDILKYLLIEDYKQ